MLIVLPHVMSYLFGPYEYLTAHLTYSHRHHEWQQEQQWLPAGAVRSCQEPGSGLFKNARQRISDANEQTNNCSLIES